MGKGMIDIPTTMKSREVDVVVYMHHKGPYFIVLACLRIEAAACLAPLLQERKDLSELFTILPCQ